MERKTAAEIAALRGKGETPEQIVELAIEDVWARHRHLRAVTSDWAMVLVEEIERLRALVDGGAK